MTLLDPVARCLTSLFTVVLAVLEGLFLDAPKPTPAPLPNSPSSTPPSFPQPPPPPTPKIELLVRDKPRFRRLS